MKTERIAGRFIVRDNPTAFWTFYLFFVMGGITALYLSLSAMMNTPTAAFGAVIGLGNIAGGVYMIKREPASIVEIDPAANRVRIRRWGIAGKRESSYPLDGLTGADVETTEHTDGGAVYRPRLCFGTSGQVPLSLFWYQTEAPSKAIVDELMEFVGTVR
jgi:hypothetical protein